MKMDAPPTNFSHGQPGSTILLQLTTLQPGCRGSAAPDSVADRLVLQNRPFQPADPAGMSVDEIDAS
jgi:hypothetical protein